MLKLQEQLEKITFPSIYIQEFVISWINLHFGKGGICYGMSASSVLYYEGWGKPVDDITFNMLKDDVDVKINIFDAQIGQLVWGLVNGLSSPRIFTNVEDDYNNKIKPKIEKGTPVVLWITLNNGGHAVVAYDIYEVSDTIKNVLVYDSNYPGMGRVIEFDFENNNINYVNVNPNFELIRAGYQNTLIAGMGFNYPQKNVKDAVRDLFKNLFDKWKIMNIFLSPINVTMVDQNGRIINDNGANEIPDASYHSIGHIKLFLIPKELDYTINIEAYDSGDFSFVLINPLTYEYAYEVSFKDIPINENSKASININSMILDYFMFIDYDGDGVTDEIKTPDNIEIIGVDFYNITFLPPITTMDQFNLTNGSTLPIKFTARNSTTDEFIYDDTVNVTITNSTGHLITYFTNGTGTDSVFIDPAEEQYIASFPTWNYALNVGETYAITVTFGEQDSLRGYGIAHFTLIDGTLPLSITNIHLASGPKWLNFTWLNPPDPDYHHVMLYLNGTFNTSILAPQNYYNFTGLEPDTLYELGTHTVDSSGNVNETWINATARTLPTNIEKINFTLPLKIGWNMVSLPIVPDHPSVIALFGSNVTTVYGWTGTQYLLSSTLEPKNGYWVLSSSNYDITVTGTPVVDRNITLTRGWKMIGPVTNGILVSSLQNVTTVYEWTGTSYNIVSGSNTLTLTKGYWILGNATSTIQV